MTDEGRRQVGTLVLVTGVLALGGLVFYLADPAASKLFWNCPFHWLTGWYCPGCGTQRALHALLHGRFKEAIFLNALGVFVVLPWGIWAYVSFSLRALGWTRVPDIRFNERWLAAFAVLVVLFGVIRNLPFPPFTWLAP
jgi:hypothetical protein